MATENEVGLVAINPFSQIFVTNEPPPRPARAGSLGWGMINPDPAIESQGGLPFKLRLDFGPRDISVPPGADRKTDRVQAETFTVSVDSGPARRLDPLRDRLVGMIAAVPSWFPELTRRIVFSPRSFRYFSTIAIWMSESSGDPRSRRSPPIATRSKSPASLSSQSNCFSV